MSMSKRILVIGSIAIDNTIFTQNLPVAGMTTLADSFFTNIGGKGANQACASLFLGGDVAFIGAVGKDKNGEMAREFLKEQGLDARLKESDLPTGVAFIILEEKTGENRILIIQGANTDVQIEDIEKNDDLFREGDILLTQFENSPAIVQYIIKKAHDRGMTIVLYPAPIKEFDVNYYQYVDYLVPNEHELESLSKTSDVLKGCQILLEKGVKNVIATLGEKGSILVNRAVVCRVKPHKVEAIDTTAAGDSYLGALVTKLSQGKDIIEAMEFASLCSSYTVTKKGAIVALPHLEDLNK